MRYPLPFAAAGMVAVVLLAMFTAGCEDSEVKIPENGVIAMFAAPGTININENSGQVAGTSRISATIVEQGAGEPQGDLRIQFFTSHGFLCPESDPDCWVCEPTDPDFPNCTGGLTPVEDVTDANGEASVLLVMTLTNPDPSVTQATVTGKAAALFGTVPVDREIIPIQVPDPNEPPLAAINPSPPAGQAIVGDLVTFDGSFSTDPDDDPITCWQWTVDSTDDTYDLFLQGTAVSAFDQRYNTEQTLAVTLRISDDPDVGLICNATDPPVPVDSLSPKVGIVNPYIIDCANQPPVAEAGPNQTATITSSSVVVLLDAGLSADPDGRIDEWVWNCGNGSTPLPSGDPPIPWRANCRYTAAGNYVAEVTVKDDGTGVIDPRTGTFECQKTDTDNTSVTITRPQ